jgi:myosin VIIa
LDESEHNDTNSIPKPTGDDANKREDLSAYDFAKFAATYFSSNTSHQFSKRQIKQSLLDLPLPADQISAQVSG